MPSEPKFDYVLRSRELIIHLVPSATIDNSFHIAPSEPDDLPGNLRIIPELAYRYNFILASEFRLRSAD